MFNNDHFSGRCRDVEQSVMYVCVRVCVRACMRVCPDNNFLTKRPLTYWYAYVVVQFNTIQVKFKGQGYTPKFKVTWKKQEFKSPTLAEKQTSIDKKPSCS